MFKPEEIWDNNSFPLAYLITFRTYGTWLHGDQRTSVDVHEDKNIYGAPKRRPNQKLAEKMRSNMLQPSFVLGKEQRVVVERAIREVCEYKNFYLRAVNVRTNHVHSVVSAQEKPEMIAELFKKYSTRALRDLGLTGKDLKLWARGRSRRYLWKNEHVTLAIDYVLYGQGDLPFEIE